MKAATIATVFMPVGLPPLFGVAIGRFLGTPGRRRAFNAVMGLSLVVLAAGLML